MAHKRCPRACTDSASIEAVRAYTWLDRFGVLPVPGGMMDQDGLFLEVVQIVEHVRSDIERERDERARQERERSKNKK